MLVMNLRIAQTTTVKANHPVVISITPKRDFKQQAISENNLNHYAFPRLCLRRLVVATGATTSTTPSSSSSSSNKSITSLLLPPEDDEAVTVRFRPDGGEGESKSTTVSVVADVAILDAARVFLLELVCVCCVLLLLPPDKSTVLGCVDMRCSTLTPNFPNPKLSNERLPLLSSRPRKNMR